MLVLGNVLFPITATLITSVRRASCLEVKVFRIVERVARVIR
jgi:hypothetical protein